MQHKYTMPAEWHRQSGVQLTWPHARTDWKDYLNGITTMFVEMTRAIAVREKVLIVTPHVDDVRDMLYREVPETLHRNIVFRHCPTNDTWARDHAFISLIAEDDETAPAMLADFKFNGWGDKFEAQLDNEINARLFFRNTFHGRYRSHTEFVLEGGAVESDGRGTVMTTTSCLLAPHRNQPLSRTDIEQKLKLWLGAERVIWIEHGALEGDDTDGHIDTLARFASDDTILYTSTDNPADPQYADLKAMEDQLRTLKTADGRPYRLLPLPIPAAIYDGEDRLPATYANFLVINGAVLCPTYGQPRYDEAALQTISRAFPDREIIGIDALTAIRQHGSLHCLTMQYPEGIIV